MSQENADLCLDSLNQDKMFNIGQDNQKLIAKKQWLSQGRDLEQEARKIVAQIDNKSSRYKGTIGCTLIASSFHH